MNSPIMRLLVVEDDPLLQHSLCVSLREEHYAVDAASQGDEGLAMALDNDYDVIILDGMLPVMHGWELLGHLRKKKVTPVLMLTARDAVEDRIKGLDAGADDYLTKPFSLDELFARVRALIRRDRGQGQNTMSVGAFTLDLAKRILTGDDGEIALTPREYALVEYLALKRGVVVSRTELYEHLFDASDDSLSNLLDVHVSNLRKKLGNALIQTRRGHGYYIS